MDALMPSICPPIWFDCLQPLRARPPLRRPHCVFSDSEVGQEQTGKARQLALVMGRAGLIERVGTRGFNSFHDGRHPDDSARGEGLERSKE